MSRVTARMERDGDGRKYVIQVSVASLQKPKLNATTEIDPGKASGSAHLMQLVYAAGAACAEYLNEEYGENHDLSRCGREAQEDFERECRISAELSSTGLLQKVQALKGGASIRNAEQQRLEVMEFILQHNGMPTQGEVAWLNRLLVRVRRQS